MKHFVTILTAVFVFSACNTSFDKDTTRVASSMAKSQKRGVAFNFSNPEDLPLLSPCITWNYNWGPDQDAIAAQWMDCENIEFCPMVWGRSFNAERIRQYVKTHPSCQYLLTFNEPNLNNQARMTPMQAAELWQPVVDLAKELKLKIVSPAMNYGTLSGYSDPFKWLDEFFTYIDPTDIYAISVHCYMASPQALKNYISQFQKYNKPVWLTEFCAWEDYAIHSAEDQMKYMSEVLNFLEQSDAVERYAWFIPRAKAGYPYMQLLTSAQPYELTDAGKVYCGFSSFDKTVWLKNSEPISASEYIAVSTHEIQVRPSTDDSGLMISMFRTGQTVDYQVCVDSDAEQMAIRYSAMADAEMYVYIDEAPVSIASLSSTGSMTGWVTKNITCQVPHGKHTIRFEMARGVINFHWFKI